MRFMDYTMNMFEQFESLKDHDFGGVTVTLDLKIHDNYFPKNQEHLRLWFENGYNRYK
jgi:hypothetical protein